MELVVKNKFLVLESFKKVFVLFLKNVLKCCIFIKLLDNKFVLVLLFNFKLL